MEQENKFKKTENDVDQVVESQDELREHPSSSSHRHGSHHHHSGSGHRSGHSSRHKKHGSSEKKRKSVLKRAQEWIDNKFSSKTLMTMSVAILLLASLLLGCMFWIENVPRDNPDIIGTQAGDTSDHPDEPSYSGLPSPEVPSYWDNMIREKTKVVKNHQTAGGRDSVSFVWASDTHIPDNDTARTDNLGVIMAAMMDNCDIPFAVLTGDIGSRVSYDTEAELADRQSMIPQHLAPLWGTERLLVALGNHDGCFGDSSCYYRKQFSPEKMWQFYFRNQAIDSRRVFSENGTYFYVDNAAQKIRFIVLNSNFGGEYSIDGNGIAVNNRFKTSCYGQVQLDWLANVALNMPKGYGAVITAHVPPNVTYTVDKVQLIGIINAYCNHTTYSGSFTAGVDGWTNNSISVDFSDAKGEIIAMFTGHVHQDTIDTTTLACPLITIISAGADVNAGKSPIRTFYSDTETSFDVVTINRRTRTIYCTRVGAGNDREIEY